MARDYLDESTRAELQELLSAVCWLEDEFQTQRLDRMLSYVRALRRQLASALN
jgi:hypothetical protein